MPWRLPAPASVTAFGRLCNALGACPPRGRFCTTIPSLPTAPELFDGEYNTSAIILCRFLMFLFDTKKPGLKPDPARARPEPPKRAGLEV